MTVAKRSSVTLVAGVCERWLVFTDGDGDVQRDRIHAVRCGTAECQGRWVPAQRTLDRCVTSRQWCATSEEEVLAAKGVGARQANVLMNTPVCAQWLLAELLPTLARTIFNRKSGLLRRE